MLRRIAAVAACAVFVGLLAIPAAAQTASGLRNVDPSADIVDATTRDYFPDPTPTPTPAPIPPTFGGLPVASADPHAPAPTAVATVAPKYPVFGGLPVAGHGVTAPAVATTDQADSSPKSAPFGGEPIVSAPEGLTLAATGPTTTGLPTVGIALLIVGLMTVGIPPALRFSHARSRRQSAR